MATAVALTTAHSRGDPIVCGRGNVRSLQMKRARQSKVVGDMVHELRVDIAQTNDRDLAWAFDLNAFMHKRLHVTYGQRSAP